MMVMKYPAGSLWTGTNCRNFDSIGEIHGCGNPVQSVNCPPPRAESADRAVRRDPRLVLRITSAPAGEPGLLGLRDTSLCVNSVSRVPRPASLLMRTKERT